MSNSFLLSMLPVFVLNLISSVLGASGSNWVTSWASMQQLTEPANLPPVPFNQSGVVFQNTTLRQTFRLSLSGSALRVRISNVFGTSDLQLTSVTVALPTNNTSGVSSITPGSGRVLTFSGEEGFIIPSGAYVLSDPVEFDARAESIITVSVYLAEGQRSSTNAITSHPGSRTTSWMTFGNYVDALNFTHPSTKSVAHWYFLSSIEVLPHTPSSALAVIGDSLADGRGSTTDGNDRWPDQLLTRILHPGSNNNNNTTNNSTNSTSLLSSQALSILNLAGGGNRVLADGLGPNALGRLERDAFSVPGVQQVLVCVGVNDIGTAAATPEAQRAVGKRLVAAYEQMVARGHALGLTMLGATITPFSGPPGAAVQQQQQQPYSDPERERTRAMVNGWIREAGAFDGVVDFDQAVRDPARPSSLRKEYDSGDYLHLNPDGYRAMADAVDLGLFGAIGDGLGGGERDSA